MLLNRAALLVVLAGCPDDTLPECAKPDAASVALVAATQSGALLDVLDGTQVPLLAAPQGGHILLVGARVRGAGDCQLMATAALRDPASQRVIGLEQRPLLLERHGDWAAPREGLDAMPNVAVCPSAAATTTIHDHAFVLEVSLASLDGTTLVTKSAMVTPTCADDYCQSDCSPLP